MLFLFLTAGAQDMTREEIQRFFTADPGNSIRTPHWLNTYQGQAVSWKGQVYKIRSRPASHRLEILVKVLPDALLYDTIVILEGNTRLDPAIVENVWIGFEGKIINGIDVVGVKQVQVLVASPRAIRLL